MMKYTISGQSKDDGKYYLSECIADGLSKYELEEFKSEQNFKPETIMIKQEKI